MTVTPEIIARKIDPEWNSDSVHSLTLFFSLCGAVKSGMPREQDEGFKKHNSGKKQKTESRDMS